MPCFELFEVAARPHKIVYVFPVTRVRTMKQPAFTLFIREIPHLYLFGVK